MAESWHKTEIKPFTGNDEPGVPDACPFRRCKGAANAKAILCRMHGIDQDMEIYHVWRAPIVLSIADLPGSSLRFPAMQWKQAIYYLRYFKI